MRARSSISDLRGFALMPKMRAFNSKAQKLTTGQVREMYAELMEGATQSSCARKWGLSVIQVGRIARGESRASETGANESPVPNFNIEHRPQDIDASAVKFAKLMSSQEPTGSGLDRLNSLAQPTELDKRVDDGLDE